MKIVEQIRMEAASQGVTASARWEAPFDIRLLHVHMLLQTQAANQDNIRAKMQLSTAPAISADPVATATNVYSSVLSELKTPGNHYNGGVVGRSCESNHIDWDFGPGLRFLVGTELYLHVLSATATCLAVGACLLVFEREL